MIIKHAYPLDWANKLIKGKDIERVGWTHLQDC